ncbi:class I mannose-6-phosphate isomerase [Engelhardtia mirabilis]|uniref:Putative mannose-6-phosphate isomerase GmuF n=1 Tax=Engelhardtia mirabilis TaxID=2528011 RepID=A0A518BFE4_9BACT|nr:putative mannose-6-phosphate isomerase GmuF [Planctomycetes bacterium Pla133]QDV00012.1 putative mannose-6-phosphate isomerase GmuF [Planctomycetes bacterium Pla86]
MANLREPLRFRREYVEKSVWGGRSLERVLGIDLPAGKRIGETWELVDRADVNSVVVGGTFDGRTLGQLVRDHGADLLGRSKPTPDGRFPLLVKFLDAAENLSVQVHPDDAGALAQGGTSEAKTEAWYFLDAGPEGGVWCGLKPGSERAAVEPAMGSAAIVEHLAWWPVKRGQALMVPGGTIHAIGAGVQLLEVQQNSDTTWRIYDWDRVDEATGQPRSQHVAQAAQSTRYDLSPRPPVGEVFLPHVTGAEMAPLARCRYFGMSRLRVTAPAELDTADQFQIYVAISGAGVLVTLDEGREQRTDIGRGDTLLVPAACGVHRFEPLGDEALDLVQLQATG